MMESTAIIKHFGDGFHYRVDTQPIVQGLEIDILNSPFQTSDIAELKTSRVVSVTSPTFIDSLPGHETLTTAPYSDNPNFLIVVANGTGERFRIDGTIVNTSRFHGLVLGFTPVSSEPVAGIGMVGKTLGEYLTKAFADDALKLRALGSELHALALVDTLLAGIGTRSTPGSLEGTMPGALGSETLPGANSGTTTSDLLEVYNNAQGFIHFQLPHGG